MSYAEILEIMEKRREPKYFWKRVKFRKMSEEI